MNDDELESLYRDLIEQCYTDRTVERELVFPQMPESEEERIPLDEQIANAKAPAGPSSDSEQQRRERLYGEKGDNAMRSLELDLRAIAPFRLFGSPEVLMNPGNAVLEKAEAFEARQKEGDTSRPISKYSLGREEADKVVQAVVDLCPLWDDRPTATPANVIRNLVLHVVLTDDELRKLVMGSCKEWLSYRLELANKL